MTTLKNKLTELKNLSLAHNALKDTMDYHVASDRIEYVRILGKIEDLAGTIADDVQMDIVDKWLKENNFPWQEDYEEYEYYCIKEEDWLDWYENNVLSNNDLVSYISTITDEFSLSKYEVFFSYRIPKEWIEKNYPNMFEFEKCRDKEREYIAIAK